jgi:lipase chaperone LimK
MDVVLDKYWICSYCEHTEHREILTTEEKQRLMNYLESEMPWRPDMIVLRDDELEVEIRVLQARGYTAADIRKIGFSVNTLLKWLLVSRGGL